MDDVKLVRKAKRGNKDALLTLIMNKKDEYYRLAYAFTGNKHDALDAMEDMILTLYEKIKTLKKDDAYYSWSKTILVNSCKNLLRKRKKWAFVEDIAIQEKSSESEYKQREQQLDIQQMLALLNDDQAEAIRLKYLMDMDYKSISEITNVSIGTVKSRVFQGLKKLKHLMGGVEDEKYGR